MRCVPLLLSLLFLSPLPAADPPTKLDSLSWLVGKWQSPAGERLMCEEHWSAPAGGAMVGMFASSTTANLAFTSFSSSVPLCELVSFS